MWIVFLTNIFFDSPEGRRFAIGSKLFYEGSKNCRCVVRMGLGRGRKIPILLLKAEGSKNDNNYNYNNYNPGRGGTGGSGKVKSSIDDDVQGGELRRPTT